MPFEIQSLDELIPSGNIEKPEEKLLFSSVSLLPLTDMILCPVQKVGGDGVAAVAHVG